MTGAAESAMPDPQTFLLPARAYLLSMRDQNLPLRRAAFDDAASHYRETSIGGGHRQHIALVALAGEALQILEDLAAYADSILSTPEGTAFFAALTRYDVHRTNNFYAQINKRSVDYYLTLLGMRFGHFVLEDACVIDPPLSDEERAAIDDANTATAELVRKHFVNLAEDWRKLRPFSNAYKHGLLVANPEDVVLVDDHDDGVTIDGIVVWQRRRPGAEPYGHIPTPFDDMADYLSAVADVALDVIEHLVESRVRFFELVDFRSDGTWTPGTLKGAPWQWWFDRNDLSEEAREQLSRRFHTTFE